MRVIQSFYLNPVLSLSEVSGPFFTDRAIECDSVSIINVCQVIDTQDIDKRTAKYKLDRYDSSSLSAKQTLLKLAMQEFFVVQGEEKKA